jgi:acyl-CoA reductase-like NAD-dependent aldehyde dehydrogenase
MTAGFLLNGKPADGGRPAEPLRSPYDGTVLEHVAQAGPAEVEAAIAGMEAAREPLARLPSYKRADACAHIHRRLVERTEDFARSIAREAGKPIRTARAEVQRAISTFKLAAEEATRISGEQLPVDIDPRGENHWAVVERFPVGPCSFITPFNFPLNLVAHKVAPALACGCPFIVKPSERTPLTALLLGDLLAETDLPPGAFSVLPCDRATARPLVSDDRIKLLSFTGSPQVGFAMKRDAGKKAVILELGNNSAVIVEPDTDLRDAIPRIVAGAFGYAGQSCISVQRIYLHARIADDATRMLVDATNKLSIGDPLDDKTDVGPVIDAAAADRLEAWIRDSGGTILCGNKRGGPQSTLFWPTLVREPRPDAQLLCEEAFGPVATIHTYTDFDEVLEKVNASKFGLQAGLFCRDFHKIRRAFERLDVGGLVVNDVPTTRIDNMPYGGVKDSGLGREGVKYAIAHMTEPRILLVRRSGSSL